MRAHGIGFELAQVCAAELALFEDVFGGVVNDLSATTITEASPLGILVAVFWWHFRFGFIMLRRRATAYVFAVGNPPRKLGMMAGPQKASFPGPSARRLPPAPRARGAKRFRRKGRHARTAEPAPRWQCHART